MRHNPRHFVDDPEIVRRLIRENPWGILVSAHEKQLVASHYPVMLDEDCDELAVFTHVGRPDDELHGFGEREIMLIVQPGGPLLRDSSNPRRRKRISARSRDSDKDTETQRRVLNALRALGSYHNPRLAEEMERALGVS
jgi:hypothetical protein